MTKTTLYAMLAGLMLAVASPVMADGDAEEGKKVFRKCQACHKLAPGQHGIGPSLAGLFGREAGKVPGFDYSEAMRQSGVVWSEDSLEKFLAEPRSFIPGNKMPFAGVRDEEQREDLIAYLEQATGMERSEGSTLERPGAAQDIVRKPTDIPPPIGKRGPRDVNIRLEAVELEGRLSDGTSYRYWTFNGKVPGPFLRVREGDRVELTMSNDADSTVTHSVDLHAVTGPGGGAAHLQVPPGESKTILFRPLAPGLYVYHCATPMVAQHIANGMYGMILVEPEGGLPEVDREFYVMQGEIYTRDAHGVQGMQEHSVEALLDERPEYFVFNGAEGALSKTHPLKADVGETVRIYFGVGGPNFTSSFHVIGEIFDRFYEWGGVISPPVEGVQTVTVPPGGAGIAEFRVEFPGNYILVDHALSRLERGLAGILTVDGAEAPEVFQTR